ncbi:glycosyltransferase [Jiangella ureilytica]|uniref:Glycosyltransferase n=1 Tax=Jiangella ureilytica TaxID=2530374 RepID=A0A4R4RDW3_9ACTN|nr:glycosyltransferase [Jiangella ureilytica]TDC47498.1 glycosyltransferase [Jiangella ureilytica]
MGIPLDDLVTTVVITNGGGDMLGRTMPRHRAPLIVVDNGSTDGAVDAAVRGRDDVRVVRLPGNIGAVARNVGVAAARTPYVAFADDDSWWAPGALDRAAAILRDHGDVALVAARILVGPGNRPDPTCARMLESPLPAWHDGDGAAGRSVIGFIACATVVRRDAFLRAGGFDDVVFFAGEEERLALDLLSAGWRLVYVPDVVAHHDPQPARDRRHRGRLIVRNSILTALMRRPWPVALGRARAALGSADGRAGLAAALPRVVSGLRQRRPVAPHVERAVAVVERFG